MPADDVSENCDLGRPPTLMVVYGTRPEAIKVAPIIREASSRRELQVVPVVTGQHREMLDQVNEVFGVTPQVDLDLFSNGQNLNRLAGRLFQALDPILEQRSPDLVLVQGDTTSVMVAAIAAFNRRIPVVHLESGLRSHNLHSPFPEEANRKLVTQVASLHLAPTHSARKNLLAEGVDPKRIVVTGNTVVDALLYTIQKFHAPGSRQSIHELSKEDDGEVDSLNEVYSAAAEGKKLILVTTHRRESWGEAMEGVGRALGRLAESNPNIVIVLPAHRNPVVRDAILPRLKHVSNVIMLEPLPYGDFTRVLMMSYFVITDSGGIQEEAPTLGKPVLVLRENTERPEAVEAGAVKLIGTNEDRIVAESSRLMDPQAYSEMSGAINPYGDGYAARRSIAAIEELLGIGTREADFYPNNAPELASETIHGSP